MENKQLQVFNHQAINKQLVLSNYLTRLRENEEFSKNDLVVIEAKYSGGPKFGEMLESERWDAAEECLLKLNVMIGWNIPADATMRRILVDQFQKKMDMSYPEVNAAEFECAFMINTSVKSWGKNVNLALIDEVMIPYLNKRFELSQIEENAVKPVPKQIADIPMSDAELMHATHETWKLIRKYEFIPPSLYESLRKSGHLILSNQEQMVYVNWIKNLIDQKSKTDIDFKKAYELISDKDLYIKNECRRYAVHMYFSKLEENLIKKDKI